MLTFTFLEQSTLGYNPDKDIDIELDKTVQIGKYTHRGRAPRKFKKLQKRNNLARTQFGAGREQNLTSTLNPVSEEDEKSDEMIFF
jgi:hypothetical protein